MLIKVPAFDARGMLLVIGCVALVLQGSAVAEEASVSHDRVGSIYEVNRDVETRTSGSRTTGSSTDRDTLIERVLKVRTDGVEIEYDLPKGATSEDRERNWRFPLRIFKPVSGQPQLLNRVEIEQRIAGWLKRGGLTRNTCGHWVFTWNAFKIECDPDSVIEIAEAYDMRFNDLRDGGVYRDPDASGFAILHMVSDGTNGASFAGELLVDPDRVRRAEAESDVVVADIGGKSLTLDEAIRARSAEKISGTISVLIEVDSSGFVQRRSKVTKFEIVAPDGNSESRTITDVVKRRDISVDGSPL